VSGSSPTKNGWRFRVFKPDANTWRVDLVADEKAESAKVDELTKIHEDRYVTLLAAVFHDHIWFFRMSIP